MNDYLMHVGVSKRDGAPVGSGRYPLGSGEHPYGQYHDFYSRVNEYRKQGLRDSEIAEKLAVYDRFGNPSTTKLRARYSLAKDERRAMQREAVMRLADQGKSNSEIGRMMGINESTVRSLLDERKAIRGNLTKETADILKTYVDKKKYVDVGEGIEIGLGVPRNRLDNAIAYLEEQGYKTQLLKIDQMGTNHKTTLKVLTPPDVTYKELSDHRYDIKTLGLESKVFDANKKIKKFGIDKPQSISSDRIYIKYNEEGGIDRDGIIELRRGVDDISLGKSMYAQVRIAVDDTHYMKGMAVYSDDIPKGYDIVFNTNKHEGTDIYKVLKPMKTVNKDSADIDWDNPFGATVTQKHYIGKDGQDHLSPINIVNEQGEWQTWSKNLPSQFLSKQPLPMAKRQLDISYLDKKVELEEINKLTNPTIKKKLLIDYADNCDAAAVDLKAAPYAKQQTHVLLAFPNLSENEIYAPNYRDGTTVALVRFPHQSPSEIPILTVRNTGSPAAEIIKNAPDAVALNSKNLERMSGADSDGDTAIVIPLSDKVKVRSQPMIDSLKGFDPKEEYAGYEGMPVITSRNKELQMGVVTNLIMDMTLQGASAEKLAPAIKHAQVIIDAEKHELDWKRSEAENHINDLKKEWQGGGGAYTIVSKAGSEYNVPERKEWRPSPSSINPDGSKHYEYTNNTYVKGKLKGVTIKNGGEVIVNTDKKTGGLYYLKKDPATGKKIRVDVTEDDFERLDTHLRMEKSTKMAETTDAYTLTSGGSKEHPGYPMEKLYAEYANNVKALANAARLEWLKTPNQEYKKEAAVTYKEQVDSLNHKLGLAKANAPRERQAQLLANEVIASKKRANPDMSKEEEKKFRGQAIAAARVKVGANKDKIEITDDEWRAIQAGAVSHTKLEEILKHADTDVLRERATPRAKQTLSTSQKALAKRMAANGYNLTDIAERLGVSTSTISKLTNEKGDET